MTASADLRRESSRLVLAKRSPEPSPGFVLHYCIALRGSSFPHSSSSTLARLRGAATGWAPWCAAPPQSGQERRAETQHLCVQCALQGPQLQEQEEERKVWGSRSCHTQMTVCGGFFSSSFSGNPDALPPLPSPAAFPLFPALGTAGDGGLHNPTPPPHPTPPHTRRPQSLLLGPRINPLQARRGNAERTLLFYPPGRREGALLPQRGPGATK